MTNALEHVLGQKFKTKVAPAKVTLFDPKPGLIEQLKTVINFDLLKQNPGTVVYDAVHGTGRDYVDAILRDCGWNVTSIHENPDPMFGGFFARPGQSAKS